MTAHVAFKSDARMLRNIAAPCLNVRSRHIFQRAESWGWVPSWLNLALLGRPDFQSRGPKTLQNQSFGTSGLKIGTPQKRQIQPRRIQPPHSRPSEFLNATIPSRFPPFSLGLVFHKTPYFIVFSWPKPPPNNHPSKRSCSHQRRRTEHQSASPFKKGWLQIRMFHFRAPHHPLPEQVRFRRLLEMKRKKPSSMAHDSEVHSMLFVCQEGLPLKGTSRKACRTCSSTPKISKLYLVLPDRPSSNVQGTSCLP